MYKQPDKSCAGGNTRGSSGHTKEERKRDRGWGGRNIDLFKKQKVIFGGSCKG